ncbi:MAG: cupin domain-containing protein [Mycobacterium sp.]
MSDIVEIPAPGIGGSGTDQTVARVGQKVRMLRSRQGLTLKDLADLTGVSVSMLSMLERGVATASVGTLVSVASALGTHMSDLFERPPGPAGSPVTRLDRQTVVRLSESTTRRIAHLDSDADLEFAVNEYAGAGSSGPGATHHDGREFGVVVSGRLTIELDGERHELAEGDVIAYSSDRPHRIVNSGDEPAVAVWVNLGAEAGSYLTR